MWCKLLQKSEKKCFQSSGDGMKQAIQPPNSAAPKGPYTPGIVASGPMLYVAAQGPFDTEGQVVGETFNEQAELAFQNLRKVVEAAGGSMSGIVKLTVLVSDLANFAAMNELCKRHLQEPYPARTPVQTAMPGGVLFLVDAIVALETK